MKCKICENIQIDLITGMMVCAKCGRVYEKSHIVEALEFDDNKKAAGKFINFDKEEKKLYKTFKLIDKVSGILSIPKYTIDYAKNAYKEARRKQFTQGRKIKQMVGAVLYLACRYNKEDYLRNYLLIDFSEVLHINIFIIGTLYIKLVKLLGLEIKIIDPSIYIPRFCKKFNLGKKAYEVEKTAKKILQFMDRDWISYGRRPAGLIGACILIAAKLHKLNIDINLISNVVHVSSQTILNRIEEFSLTRVASMTKEEFEIFQESHFYPGSDPPSFLKSIKENEKKEKEEKKIENEKEENNKNGKIIENGGQKVDNNNNYNDTYNLRSGKSGLSKNSDLNIQQNRSGLNMQKAKSGISNKNDSFSLSLKPNKSGLSNNSDFLFFKPSNSGISRKNSLNNNESEMLTFEPNKSGLNRGDKRISGLSSRSLPEEKLSNIPENEEYKYIYSKEEYGVRKQFWEIMFKDWIESQKEKEEKEGKEKNSKVKKEPRKRIKTMIFKFDGSKRAQPDESIKSSNKFGKKINYSYVKSMMSKRK